MSAYEVGNKNTVYHNIQRQENHHAYAGQGKGKYIFKSDGFDHGKLLARVKRAC